jgi:hypothetical protein
LAEISAELDDERLTEEPLNQQGLLQVPSENSTGRVDWRT